MQEPGDALIPIQPTVPRYPFGAAAVAAYGILVFALGKLGWQHVGLLAFIWACLAPQPAPRRFIRDWWPMILFWLGYDSMRLFSSLLFSRVAVEAPLRWESRWFLSPDGVIWPFYFARWMARHTTEFWPRVLHAFSSAVYFTQLFGIPSIMLLIWARGHDRLFRRLVWSLTGLHAVSLLIYLLYPAAPPWWVYENGSLQPTVAHSMPRSFARGSTLAGLFQVSPNRFAAIPSLHGAYPLLLTFVLAYHGVHTRWIALAFVYTSSMWFACVFLNQHYIVDLLIGAVLVLIALPLAALRP